MKSNDTESLWVTLRYTLTIKIVSL